MRTAIFTVKDTKLTIETSEELQLVQMGQEGKPIKLLEGTNKPSVGPGVFKIESNSAVRVTADTQDLQVMSTPNNKDGDWPDPSKIVAGFNPDAVRKFFLNAKSQTPPR